MDDDDPMSSRSLDLVGPLDLEPIDPGAVVDGRPAAGSRALATVAGAEVGIWEHTVGTSTDVEVDEVFVVLAGRGTVAFEDGEVIDLAPGVAVRLTAGERTTWRVEDALRKVYVSRD